MIQYQGVGAAGGQAIGPAYVIRRQDVSGEERPVGTTAEEWARFQQALEQAARRFQSYYEIAEREVGAENAAIFEAQLAISQDPELHAAIQAAIEQRGAGAEAAVTEATEFFAQMLEGMENEYFQQRAADVRAIGSELVEILSGKARQAIHLPCPSIIIAEDLTPAQTILIDKNLILGFCTARGGSTSHTAILARSLGLPAVVGAGVDILSIEDGCPIMLDGTAGTLFVNPPAEVQRVFAEKLNTTQGLHQKVLAVCQQPAVTRDGHKVEVVANIGSIESARAAVEKGAEGVGLLRTEFLYLERSTLPTEEEQFQAYRAILEVFGDRPVVLRTLDIGGDKELPYLVQPAEKNPFLGVRGLRLSLKHPDLFRPQLRAVLRAGVSHNLKVMFPMVATVQEVRRARQLLDDCRQELCQEGLPQAEYLEIGIMVEIPSAAILADVLVQEVDFFSIGTNDLTQYTLAVDRTNAELDYLGSAFHPAVLRLIDSVIRAAHSAGKWVGVCGELAGEPLAAPILLGLGLDEFSMNAPAIPLVKEIIRQLNRPEAQDIAAEALQQADAVQVNKIVLARLPWLADFQW
ncbi:MAG TPA: phosphoenolpyruvate--protein phosphotransferase [Anaerolineales bacterium]|nr:phosphoenolpyruvate--protein phosphotransferase [Anaerolineales bacterium]